MPFPTHWSSCKCPLFLDPALFGRNMAWCAGGEKQPWLCPWTQGRPPGKATDAKVTEAVRASLAMTLLIYWPWFVFPPAQPRATSLGFVLVKAGTLLCQLQQLSSDSQGYGKDHQSVSNQLRVKGLELLYCQKNPKQNKPKPTQTKSKIKKNPQKQTNKRRKNAAVQKP